jgi:hypothetical protein
MKFHKHVRDLYVLKRISSSVLHFSSIIFFNELSVLVLFSRSHDFIPGITFKDVQRFEERNKNVFFFIPRGNRRYKNVISPVHLI